MIEILEAQIITIRQQAIALVAACDGMLHMVEALRPEPAAPAKVGNPDVAKCQHPEADRQDAPTFGDPNGWYCPHCRMKSDELAKLDAEADMRAAGVTLPKEG